ncbi:MAG TPA: glycosyltransferase [Candidatus Methanoperedens sp.]|nr:glycosyltransferase [Candidatus Methanoperedens sp.]
MSVLIACSYEVGGQPFRMAEVLNRRGLPAWYLSLAPPGEGHDSTRFHHGEQRQPWDITARIRGGDATPGQIVRSLAAARRELGIRAAFATGAEAHLVGRAGIPYRYWCYGADLDWQSFGPLWPEGYPAARKAWVFCRFALGLRRRQRLSLRNAAAIMIAPYQKSALDRIRPGAPLFALPHLLRVEEHGQLLARRAAERDKVRRLVGAERFVFSAARHVWCGALAAHADNKGNDVALRAFALWRGQGGDPRLPLVLVRKGPDAEASRRFVAELGLGGAVRWLDEMPRDELAQLYRGADLCLGQFGTPVITYAMLEPLAEGTPCLSHFVFPHPGVPGYPEPPPGLAPREPEGLAREIGRLLEDDAARAAAGERSWAWVREHCSEERFVTAFRDLFADAV